MSRIYYYKLKVDSGGAPCVQNGLLSLAICKPFIRTSAEPGAIIFGFAANSLDPENRLLYIAEVTDKVRYGRYYEETRFARRADCIYARRGDRFAWRSGAKHHGPEDVLRDLGAHPDYRRAQVLLSENFRYLGTSGTADYKREYSLIKHAVEHLGQGHRVRHPERLRAQLLDLKQAIWAAFRRTVVGTPLSAPKRGACHRSRSCGLVDAADTALD